LDTDRRSANKLVLCRMLRRWHNVVNTNGPIYSSTNAGITWVSNAAPALDWQSVASSADGALAYAGARNGGIWHWRATPALVLGITAASDGVSLSWLIPSAHLVLEQASSLTAGTWGNVTIPPVLNLSNLHNGVNVPIGENIQFYRLAVP